MHLSTPLDPEPVAIYTWLTLGGNPGRIPWVPTAHSPDESRARLLGERLRELRASKGLSQEAVAHAAGITRNHYQLLEAGITASGRPANPRLGTIIALSEALKVAPEDLIK